SGSPPHQIHQLCLQYRARLQLSGSAKLGQHEDGTVFLSVGRKFCLATAPADFVGRKIRVLSESGGRERIPVSLRGESSLLAEWQSVVEPDRARPVRHAARPNGHAKRPANPLVNRGEVLSQLRMLLETKDFLHNGVQIGKNKVVVP